MLVSEVEDNDAATSRCTEEDGVTGDEFRVPVDKCNSR